MEHRLVARHELRAARGNGFQLARRLPNGLRQRIRIAVSDQPASSLPEDLQPEIRALGGDYRFARSSGFAKYAACSIVVFLQVIGKEENVSVLEEMQVAVIVQRCGDQRNS